MKTLLLIISFFISIQSNLIHAAATTVAEAETKTNEAALNTFKEYLKSKSDLFTDIICKSPLLADIENVALKYTSGTTIEFKIFADVISSCSLSSKILKTKLLAEHSHELHLAMQTAQSSGVSKEVIDSALDDLFVLLTDDVKAKVDYLFYCTLIEYASMKATIQMIRENPKLLYSVAFLFKNMINDAPDNHYFYMPYSGKERMISILDSLIKFW